MTDVLERPAQPLATAPARTPTETTAQRTARRTVQVISINTHRGLGPKLPYLLRDADPERSERIQLLHDTRAYAYHIAAWIQRHRDRYDVVGLQEVFQGVFGLGSRMLRHRSRQRDYYRSFGGYPEALSHRVGFAAFRYENLILSRLPEAPSERLELHLPGRVFRLAACGFSLAPYRLGNDLVWIGNTHLHAYDPRARTLQAKCIAKAVRELGDVPIVLLGDLNTVPPGCKDGDFPEGDRDVKSYKGDRTLGVLADAGLGTVEHADTTDFHTYPTGAPNRTLDYVLFSEHFEVESYRAVHEFHLSDHYPVEARLRLK